MTPLLPTACDADEHELIILKTRGTAQIHPPAFVLQQNKCTVSWILPPVELCVWPWSLWYQREGEGIFTGQREWLHTDREKFWGFCDIPSFLCPNPFLWSITSVWSLPHTPIPCQTTAFTCVFRCFPCDPSCGSASWATPEFSQRSVAPMVKMTRSKTFQAYLPSCHRTYSCIHCRAHLANHDELISK
ncbi:protein yippee-like 2 isoform X1 [Vidua macroura]|uniref:protein yippee-like 2 isoform X1 n=1 Tax=Vidua macroura TaxID=187451 RepID=UPI0023A82EE1|nr:protein yippee-like 2 isoform X1 [Vidua macroura]